MRNTLQLSAQLIEQQRLLAMDALPVEEGDRWVTIRGRHVLISGTGEVKTGWNKGQVLQPTKSDYDRAQIRRRAADTAEGLQYEATKFNGSLERQGRFYARDLLQHGVSLEPIQNLMSAISTAGARELQDSSNVAELDKRTAAVEHAAHDGIYEALRSMNQIAHARSTFNSLFFDNADIRAFNQNGGDYEVLRAVTDGAISVANHRVEETASEIEREGVGDRVRQLCERLQATSEHLNALLQTANNVRSGTAQASELTRQMKKLNF